MKRFFFIACFVLLFLPVTALAFDYTVSNGDTFNLGICSSGDTVTVSTGATATLTGTAPNNVSVTCEAGVTLTLSGVSIDNSSNFAVPALSFTGGVNNLYLTGVNSLQSGINRAGVRVGPSTTLNISGTGSLSVTGGDYASGIGGNEGEACGTVNILSGTITAAGGTSNGAGIGGGNYGAGGTVSISGGTVTATGGLSAAGIGGGYSGGGGTITISGTADVTATGGGTEQGGAGIGGGYSGSGGTITILGGTVKATGAPSSSFVGGGAGIGGGGNGNGGTIKISGGSIDAYSGILGSGAGIGGGYGGTSGTVEISGGTILAQSDYGAGIGGGNGGAGSNIKIYGTADITAAGGNGSAGIGGGQGNSGGTIEISGGTVDATGGESGAGIGGGRTGDGGMITISGTADVTAAGGSGAAGIGGGLWESGGNISISGGTVVATGGPATISDNGGAGIGGGDYGSGGIINISAGTVTATGGLSAAGIGGAQDGGGGAISLSGGTIYAEKGPASVSELTPAYDIGAGANTSDGTLTISGTAAVFLRYNTYLPNPPALPDGHENKTPSDAVDPMIFSGNTVYGLTVPASWTSSLGGFFRLVTVTYDANGGDGTPPDSPPVQHIGTTVTVADGSGLLKTGYTNLGWNTQASGGGTSYSAGSSVTLTADMTLYVLWNAPVMPQTGDSRPAGHLFAGLALVALLGMITALNRRRYNAFR